MSRRRDGIDDLMEDAVKSGEQPRKEGFSYWKDFGFFLAAGIMSSTHHIPLMGRTERLAIPMFRAIRCAIGFGTLGAVAAGTGLIAGTALIGGAIGAAVGVLHAGVRHKVGLLAEAISHDTYQNGVMMRDRYRTAEFFGHPLGFALAWAIPLAVDFGAYKGLEAVHNNYSSPSDKTTQIETTKGSLQNAFANRVAFDVAPVVQQRKASAPALKL